MKMIRSNIKFVIPSLTCIVFLLICYYNKDNNGSVEVLHHDNSENVKYFKDRNNLVNVLSGSVANNVTSLATIGSSVCHFKLNILKLINLLQSYGKWQQ